MIPPYRPSPLGRRRPRRRHGVLLLIVLCVLFMFLLLALTYTVVASKERAMTRNYARFERASDPPNVVLDELAMVLFRDTNDTHSPFLSWSLLEGIYGNVSFRGTVGSLTAATTTQTGGQFITIVPSSVQNQAKALASVPNYYEGCVLTMLTGQCAGLSTRIVASTGTSLTVMRFESDAGVYDPSGPSGNVPGDTFLVNGRPYSGMGRGYNTSGQTDAQSANGGPGAGTGLTFTDDAIDPSMAQANGGPLPSGTYGYYALLPNPVGFVGNSTYGSDPAGPGGANVDYTAADYNNCYLALMLNLANPQGAPGVLPSFYRPALYNYWAQTANSQMSNPQLLRRISFRPNSQDHPVFTTNTNPNFFAGANPTTTTAGSTSTNPVAQFDVDNLGGGTPDSIWIDPGLPVTTSRDGRPCKILVAPCILDLDGRINVNAHGSIISADHIVNANNLSNQTGPNPPNGYTTNGSLSAIAGASISPLAPITLPLGQGYGPASVNLNALFSPAEVSSLIYGSSSGWDGRYGGGPGTSNGYTTTNQALELLKFFEYPTNDPRSTLTSFNSPPDLKDRRMIALDPRGQPNFIAAGQSQTLQTTYWQHEVIGVPGQAGSAESPYAFKLDHSVPHVGRYVSQTQVDDPYTVGELETVLREYDGDMRSLPQRLYRVLTTVQPNAVGFDANKRNKLTTDSWDLPSPNYQVPRQLRTFLASNGYRATGIIDLVTARLQSTGAAGNQAEIAKLVSPDLIAGLRMDINRPLGNGRDDNGNGLVDEPGGITGGTNTPSPPDSTTETIMPQTNYPSSSGFSGGEQMNLVNWASTLNPADPLMSSSLPAGVKARQLLARHLYALAMLLADPNYIANGNWTSDPTAPAGSTQRQQLFARRMAQWAINVVSFRDTTSIMTPFMYQWDIYQSTYQGWVVDGDPGHTSATGAGSQPTTNYGIVWACKPPDAIITETLAFHDKRQGDSKWDDGAGGRTQAAYPADKIHDDLNDFDQIQIPQGSLFIELNCVRNPNTSFAPQDLYTKSGLLDLGRMSPDNQNPVWRLVISQHDRNRSTSNLITPNTPNDIGTYTDTLGFEPTMDSNLATSNPATAQSTQQMNVLNPANNLAAERVIWLGPQPAKTVRDNVNGWPAAPNTQMYYLNPAPAQLQVEPGSYVLIAPRAVTHIGAQGDFNNPAGTNPKQWGYPSQQVISFPATAPFIRTNTVSGPGGQTNMPNLTASNIKTSPYNTTVVFAVADPPSTWTTQNASGSTPIGISVSEPMPATGVYYKQPTVQNPASGIYDAYGDLMEAGGPKFPDQPFEETTITATSPYATYPLNKDAIQTTRTNQCYKVIFLQRLADPTSGWDELRNPYITVDWMPIDLTVFNGDADPAFPNPLDAAATPNKATGAIAVNFASRQRGGSDPNSGLTSTYNLWSMVPRSNPPGKTIAQDLPQSTKFTTGITNDNINVQLVHTLGYLNQAFGSGMVQGNTVGQAPTAQYVGDPPQPFPWIDWNARPYASPMELLNVPASSPDRLLFEFNSPGTQVAYGPNLTQIVPPTPSPTASIYGPAAGTFGNIHAPFGHLLNFFMTADSNYTVGQSSNFYQLLEYLQVPSRFVGTETYLNPSTFSSGAAATAYFLPPFNYVSNYRDPGKINLNTITAQEVYNGLMNGLGTTNGQPTPSFTEFCNSRTGNNSPTAAVINSTNPSSMPTYFPRPFRSAAAADLVPLQSMLAPGVSLTLLRPGVTSTTTPLFGQVATNAWNNCSRNSYFAYQGLERIANNVTTRSNVFGVWLTIGYFEAIPNSNPKNGQIVLDAGHPDGWQIGAEIGSDTGDVERHRAFYIFDRSIPVGYERGQNHNVNRAILLKRYIE